MYDLLLVSSDSSEMDAHPRLLSLLNCRKTIIAVQAEETIIRATRKQDRNVIEQIQRPIYELYGS